MITFPRAFPNFPPQAVLIFASLVLRVTTAQEVVATKVADSPRSIEFGKDTIFGGRPHRLEWVLSSDKATSGDARLSIYRILDTTAVQVESGKLIASALDVSEGRPSIVLHEFTPPETDRITSYLIVLSFVKNEASKSVANEVVTVIPPDLLGQVKGIRIFLIGFKEGDDEVQRFLELSGWKVTVHEKTPESSDADLAVHTPESTPPLSSKKTLIYRDFSEGLGKPSPVVTVIGKNPSGEEIRWEIPLPAWKSLPTSADQQLLLVKIARTLSTPP